MATSELIEALQMLAHERKIDEFYLIERLEESLAKSYQHILDLEWDARVTIDRETGKIYVYELVPVGEPDEETGEYSEFEESDVTPSDVSRIAAQNAKSVISSIVRDAGRQSIYEEFSHRIGDLVTGTVLQGTPDFTIIKNFHHNICTFFISLSRIRNTAWINEHNLIFNRNNRSVCMSKHYNIKPS